MGLLAPQKSSEVTAARGRDHASTIVPTSGRCMITRIFPLRASATRSVTFFSVQLYRYLAGNWYACFDRYVHRPHAASRVSIQLYRCLAGVWYAYLPVTCTGHTQHCVDLIVPVSGKRVSPVRAPTTRRVTLAGTSVPVSGRYIVHYACFACAVLRPHAASNVRGLSASV